MPSRSGAPATKAFRAKLADSIYGVTELELMGPVLRGAATRPADRRTTWFQSSYNSYSRVDIKVVRSIEVLRNGLRLAAEGHADLYLTPRDRALFVELERRFDREVRTMYEAYPQLESLFEGKRQLQTTKDVKACYIATSVYGSYDAPEVLVLRRYRDESLSRSMIGRGFIRAYYRVGPHVVRHGGGLVRRLSRWPLDVLVDRLRRGGDPLR